MEELDWSVMIFTTWYKMKTGADPIKLFLFVNEIFSVFLLLS